MHFPSAFLKYPLLQSQPLLQAKNLQFPLILQSLQGTTQSLGSSFVGQRTASGNAVAYFAGLVLQFSGLTHFPSSTFNKNPGLQKQALIHFSSHTGSLSSQVGGQGEPHSMKMAFSGHFGAGRSFFLGGLQSLGLTHTPSFLLRYPGLQ